jgi:hypothetical protein
MDRLSLFPGTRCLIKKLTRRSISVHVEKHVLSLVDKRLIPERGVRTLHVLRQVESASFTAHNTCASAVQLWDLVWCFVCECRAFDDWSETRRQDPCRLTWIISKNITWVKHLVPGYHVAANKLAESTAISLRRLLYAFGDFQWRRQIYLSLKIF